MDLRIQPSKSMPAQAETCWWYDQRVKAGAILYLIGIEVWPLLLPGCQNLIIGLHPMMASAISQHQIGREGEAPQPVPAPPAQGAGHPRKQSDTVGLNGAQSHAIGIIYSIDIAG
jgi:hypothetical protein